MYILKSLFLTTAFIFSPFAAAQTDEPALITVDPNLVEFELNTGADSAHELTIDSRRSWLVALDWMSYVTCLETEDYTDITSKVNDKRAVYGNEQVAEEMLYVPSKNYLQYIDISGLVADVLVDRFVSASHVEIEPNECDVYLIRSYSGALGLKDDPEERSFAVTNLDQGVTRMNAALTANLVVGGVDAVSVFFPTQIAGDASLWGEIIAVAVAKASAKQGVLMLAEDGPAEAPEILETMKEIGSSILTTSFDIGVEHVAVEGARRSVLERTSTFIGNVVDAGFSVVDGLGKANSVGQVALRASGLIAVSPLETAYAITTPLATLEEVEKSSNQDLAEEGVGAELIEDQITEEIEFENSVDTTGTDTEPTETTSETETPKPTTLTPDSIVAHKYLSLRLNDPNTGTPYLGEIPNWKATTYTTGGEELGGMAKKVLDERFGEKIYGAYRPSVLQPGTYVIKWEDMTLHMQTTGHTIRRSIEAGSGTVTVPNDENWYVELPAHTQSIEYNAIWRNHNLPLSITIIDENGEVLERTPASNLVHQDGTRADLSAAGLVQDKDNPRKYGIQFSTTKPGEHILTIEANEYKTETVRFTLPDVSDMSDREILNTNPLQQDLGTITLERL